MTPLFLDKTHKLTFEKIAMPVRLSESPESWQRDIASEVYKQLPFIGDYAVNVILEKVDAQRGYGFGSAHVSNKTDAPMPDQAEMPSVRIPIIIRDYMMAPLDVFMDSSGVYPLSESRLREKLFRTDSVELSTRKPSDKGLVDQLYPPMRTNYGMGSIGGDTMGMGKMAEARFAQELTKKSALVDLRQHLTPEEQAHIETHLVPQGIYRNPWQGHDKEPGLLGKKRDVRSDAMERVQSSNWYEKHPEAKVKHANPAEMARRSAVARMKSEAASNPDHIGSEKGASLISAIAPTISEQQADSFVHTITSDPAVKLAAARNSTFEKLAMTIAGAPRTDVEKTASRLVDSIKPTVVQFVKLASGQFNVKWANAAAFAPQQDQVDAGAANRMAGTDLSQMQPGSSITLSTEKAQKQSLDEPVFIKIEEFGKYTVQDMESNGEHVGWVIPIIDFEMQPLELFVFCDPGQAAGFSGGSDEPAVQSNPAQPGAWAVQDEIAGKPSGGSIEEFFSEIGEKDFHPSGSGVFVSITGQRCLLPMTIQNGSQNPDGSQGFQGETLFGEPVTLQYVPGLKAIQMMGEGAYGIPEDLVWLPLPGEPVFLAKSPEDIEMVQQGQQVQNQVQVGSTGPGEFSMDGPPLAKVAREQKQFIKKAEAEFLLVAMGVNPFMARDALARAELGTEQVKLACNHLVPLAYLHQQMTKKASKSLDNFPWHLRQDLVKEATVIDDADTADKVLAMNFLNPDNISTFAKYLPELDEASKKLAEMLVATRLGMSGPDESAVERAMIGMERVIAGLKLLQQNSSEPD